MRETLSLGNPLGGPDVIRSSRVRVGNEYAILREVGARDGIGVLLLYAVMALVDCLGALSSQAGLIGVSSTLFFIWFAVAPLPVCALCNCAGTVRVLRCALSMSIVACVLLAAGARHAWCAFAGFCLAGLANVSLQVAVPAWAAESVPSRCVASVLTAGLFAKTAVAVAFPFLVSAMADVVYWWLSLAPFVAFSVAACFFAGSSASEGHAVGAAHDRVLFSFGRVLGDPVACCAAVAFAIAIVADVVFNLSVPGVVARRFFGGGTSVGVVYSVWFGVKLPLMLVGSRLFLRYGARRFFGVAALVSLAGVVLMLACNGFGLYLLGVGLFAAGFANVYGHVFGAAVLRHPDCASAVSALLVMAISSGALASPLLALVGECESCASESLLLACVALLLPFAAILSTFRGKP